MQRVRFTRITTLFVLLTLLMTGAAATGQEADEFQPDFHPTLHITPTTGAIDIDGDLSDEGWRTAARATSGGH